MSGYVPKGTLFVAPNGDAYRLRDYGIDWRAEPFTGDKTLPAYDVQLVSGGNTTRYALPPDAQEVFRPTTDLKESDHG